MMPVVGEVTLFIGLSAVVEVETVVRQHVAGLVCHLHHVHRVAALRTLSQRYNGPLVTRRGKQNADAD